MRCVVARITIKCPVCLGRTTARSSRAMSRTMREITYRCENDECGHVYIATLEVVRTLVPSAMPNPEVSIPLSLAVQQRLEKYRGDNVASVA
ncbi:ogr/Delta-like zinc finger family protein [Burkholderia contaminans]|uniref:ogr/Delta-like zinc finger family protein n=1 Tax=Burkholderia contaminans TaxID=488447 RepID=UPI00158253D0|nr:ogr/Delta-like zinc finger family protein [Burkholderia contaminans]